jgi:ABC-type uncharacterized transport system fused permease/ATPase subunit
MNKYRMLTRLWRLLKPFWLLSDKKWQAWTMLAVATALGFVTAYLVVIAGKLTGDAITQMQLQQEHAWMAVVAVYASLTLLLTPSNCISDFLRTRLALTWYEWSSRHLFAKAYGYGGLLPFISADPRVDNPGQVLTQENESFINTFVGLAMSFISAVIRGVMLLTQLFFIAYMLSVAAFAWSLVGSIVVFAIGRSLAALTAEQSRTDASLRMELENAADHDPATLLTAKISEPAVESSGVLMSPEQAEADKALLAKMTVLWSQMWVNLKISLANVPFKHLTSIVPIVVIGPFYFHSLMEIGTVTTAVFAFGLAVDSATMFVKEFPGISSMAANIKRLGTVVEVLDEYTAVARSHPENPRPAMHQHLLALRRQVVLDQLGERVQRLAADDRTVPKTNRMPSA